MEQIHIMSDNSIVRHVIISWKFVQVKIEK